MTRARSMTDRRLALDAGYASTAFPRAGEGTGVERDRRTCWACDLGSDVSVLHAPTSEPLKQRR
jgi:hypothetical protein